MLSENLYAAFAFLKIKLNGINAKTNTKKDKESLWKIPFVIIIIVIIVILLLLVVVAVAVVEVVVMFKCVLS